MDLKIEQVAVFSKKKLRLVLIVALPSENGRIISSDSDVLASCADEQGAPIATPYTDLLKSIYMWNAVLDGLVIYFLNVQVCSAPCLDRHRGFGEVFLGVVAVPAGVGPGGAASVQAAMGPACVGVAVKRLAPVRLQGGELVEWKQDALVRCIYLCLFSFVSLYI